MKISDGPITDIRPVISLSTRSSYFRKVMAIVWKDFIAEFRTKERFSTMFIYTILITVIFNFSFELGPQKGPTIISGMIWVALAFASVLVLSRSFTQEREGGCLESLLLLPVHRSAIYFGKLFANIDLCPNK